jgi:hypothetical protein
MAITGVHVILHTLDADADREWLADVWAAALLGVAVARRG